MSSLGLWPWLRNNLNPGFLGAALGEGGPSGRPARCPGLWAHRGPRGKGAGCRPPGPGAEGVRPVQGSPGSALCFGVEVSARTSAICRRGQGVTPKRAAPGCRAADPGRLEVGTRVAPGPRSAALRLRCSAAGTHDCAAGRFRPGPEVAANSAARVDALPFLEASSRWRWSSRNAALAVSPRVFWESQSCLPPPLISGLFARECRRFREGRLGRAAHAQRPHSRQASGVAAQCLVGDVVLQAPKPRFSAGGGLGFPECRAQPKMEAARLR